MGDLENEVLKDMETEFAEAVIKEVLMSVSTVSSGVYADYNATSATITPAVTVDSVKSFAGNNLLTVAHTTDMTTIAQMSEDNFKKMSKKNLSDALQQEIIKKTKFTMLKDHGSHTVRTKASVYVFSEEDLRIFIEKLMSYR